MRILIGVSNFGKIKSAEIDVSNFTIFVGNNNSGKSYMMQLIYGILQSLPEFELPADDYKITENLEMEWGTEWFRNYEKKVNIYLNENKENIVGKIFYKPIPIGKIYLRIIEIDEKIKIRFSERKAPSFVINDTKKKKNDIKEASQIRVDIKRQECITNKTIGDYGAVFFPNAEKEYIKLSVEQLVIRACLASF